MGLSQHTRSAVANAICNPAASDELIRLIEKLSDFVDRVPIPEGGPIATPATADTITMAEPEPPPDTGMGVDVIAEATVVPAATEPVETDPTALTAAALDEGLAPPDPPTPTEPPAPPSE
jgi:hypothetical protein